MGLHEETMLGALTAVTWRNKRRYGGYIVHIGAVLVFAGIAGSQAYGNHIEKHLKTGETFKVRGYDITYEKLVAVEATSVKTRVIAQLQKGSPEAALRVFSQQRFRNPARPTADAGHGTRVPPSCQSTERRQPGHERQKADL